MFWRIAENPEYNKDQYIPQPINIPIKPLSEPFWWGDIPFSVPKPEFSYMIPDDLKSDVFFGAARIDIYHKRIIKILRDFDVRFETFKTIFFDTSKKETIELPYKVFRLLEMYDALDYESSIIEYFTIGGLNHPIYKKLVFKPSFLKLNRHFFRLSKHLPVEIVSDKLKNEFERQSIKGFSFEKI